jgi:folate-dependent phosphoribosylglycinamide formyltransferase PurN
MEKTSVLIMTGNKLRHKFFAIQLLKQIGNSMLLLEKQPIEPWGAHVKEPSALVKAHFNAFYEEEKKFFGKEVSESEDLLRDRTFLEIDEGETNSDFAINQIRDLNPKVIPVFSTSLLKEKFIKKFPKRLINFHAGLSPYYRGTGTNVFPFYNNELEYVGVTLHYIDTGIDSGDIILQGRPVFEIGDNTHTIGCKNVILAANLMIDLINSYLQNGPPIGEKQNHKLGRIYYKKDFTEEVVSKIYERIADGIIENYVSVQPKPLNIVEKLRYE